MLLTELTRLLISFAYAAGLLGLAELMHRKLDVPAFYTRKFVHIWAGMWVIPTMMLFYRSWMGLIPFAVFIVVNFLLHRYRLARSVDDGENLGTVFFAISITLLFGLLWRPTGPNDYGPIAAAGVMAMTWGDGLAALVGRTWGRRTYQIFGNTRTLEGTAVMFLASFVAIFLVLRFVPGTFVAYFATWLTVPQSLIAALVGATVAAAIEAITPRGYDNLTVPLLTSGAIFLLAR